jgi:hypothetical protein
MARRPSRRAATRLRGALTLGAACAATCPAQAAEPLEWYAGLSRTDNHVEVWRSYAWEQGAVRDGIGFRGGVRLREHLALEFGVLHTSDLEWHECCLSALNSLTFYDTRTSFDLLAEQVSVLGVWRFARIWDVFVKGGLVHYHADGAQTLFDGVSSAALQTRQISKSASDGAIGFGVGVDVGPNWHIRTEWQTFTVANDFLSVQYGDWSTLDTLALGVDYRFGRRPR